MWKVDSGKCNVEALNTNYITLYTFYFILLKKHGNTPTTTHATALVAETGI
jgi:hypothetical protein